MKNKLIVVLLLANNLLFAQPSYEILKNHKLYISPIKNISFEKVQKFKVLFDSIFITDQTIRTEFINSMKNDPRNEPYYRRRLIKGDSLDFIAYMSFFKKFGYFSFNKNVIGSYLKDAKYFLSKHYVLQLHFTDRFACIVRELIENSIPKHTCNEEDLMDYFVTNLYRKTQFTDIPVIDNEGFCLVPIPDLDSGEYAPYYKFAFNKYMEYCPKINKDFHYIVVSDVNIDCKNNINWNGIKIKYINPLFLDYILKTINHYRKLLEDALILNNKFCESKFSILICTNPMLLGSPSYNF